MDDGVVVDLVRRLALLRRPRHLRDDAVRFVVPLHQPVRRREVRGGQIGRPRLRIAVRQLLLDVRERGRRLDALAHQQVDGIGAQARVGQRAGRRRGEPRQPVVEAGRAVRAGSSRRDPWLRSGSARRRPSETPRSRARTPTGRSRPDRSSGRAASRRSRRAVARRDFATAPNSGREMSISAENPLLTQLLGARVLVVIEVRRESLPQTSGTATRPPRPSAARLYMIARQRRRGAGAVDAAERQLRAERRGRTHATLSSTCASAGRDAR